MPEALSGVLRGGVSSRRLWPRNLLEVQEEHEVVRLFQFQVLSSLRLRLSASSLSAQDRSR